MKFSKRKEQKFVEKMQREYEKYEHLKCETCRFKTDGYCNNPDSNYCNRMVPDEAFCHWWEDGSDADG